MITDLLASKKTLKDLFQLSQLAYTVPVNVSAGWTLSFKIPTYLIIHKNQTITVNMNAGAAMRIHVCYFLYFFLSS